MKKIATFALLLILSLTIVATSAELRINAVSSEDNWPMFNHDLSHTGFSTSTAPKINQTLWTFTTGGAVETSPAVVDGIVYVGSDDGYVYALNAANGSLIWKYNTYGPVQSSPAVVDGVVYIGGFHSHAVFALNAYTGELIWSSPTNSVYPNEISSTSVANGLVYVSVCAGTFGGEFYALNASTGNLAWKYNPSSWLFSSPTVYCEKVYIGTSACHIVALDAISGNISWDYLVTSNGPSSHTADGTYFGYSALLVSNNLVYFGTSKQTVQAWNASNGELVWNGNIYGSVDFSTLALANGVIYASTTVGGTPGNLNFGGVTALNARTGALLWNHTLGSVTYSSPAVADGVVFVGSDGKPSPLGDIDGKSVYALDAATGATLWTYTTGGPVCSSPAVAYGVVYVGSNDTKVYAIGTSQNTIPSPSVPEFPSWTILPLIVVVTLVGITIRNKIRKNGLG